MEILWDLAVGLELPTRVFIGFWFSGRSPAAFESPARRLGYLMGLPQASPRLRPWQRATPTTGGRCRRGSLDLYGDLRSRLGKVTRIVPLLAASGGKVAGFVQRRDSYGFSSTLHVVRNNSNRSSSPTRQEVAPI